MSNIVDIVVSGSTGRVGSELIRLIELDEKLNFILGISGSGNWEQVTASPQTLVVDFSLPEGFDKALCWCLKNQVPLVSGTTGLSKKQFKDLEMASAKIPVFWASNMSIGVSVVKKMMRHFSELSDFDFQVMEAHHIHKKDAPSGTAITLQEALESAIGKKTPIPESIRTGEVFGEHKITATSKEEVISIEHRALNRAVFAKGALRAAKWLISQAPGIYTMDDMN